MEPLKIADGVTDLVKFMEQGTITINEKITMLRSAADLLSQVLIMEASAASIVATFKNIHEKK
jgi:hypothetical protein